MFIVLYPFNLLRKLTIPYYTESTWNRTYATSMPLCSVFFVLYTQDGIFYIVLHTEVLGAPLYVYGIIFSVIASVLVFCTSKRTVLPTYNNKLTILSFVMSILWICSICEVMVDLLSLLGILLNLPISILGLTMLAWGNSAGDFCANPAIAKLGMQQTAITACFAGPLFNTLIGFGVSLILACTISRVTFNILDHTELLIAGTCLLGCSLASIAFLLRNQGKITVFHGKTQIFCYLSFFAILICYTLIWTN